MTRLGAIFGAVLRGQGRLGLRAPRGRSLLERAARAPKAFLNLTTPRALCEHRLQVGDPVIVIGTARMELDLRVPGAGYRDAATKVVLTGSSVAPLIVCDDTNPDEA